MQKRWLALVGSAIGMFWASLGGSSPARSATMQTIIDFQSLQTSTWNYTGLVYRQGGFTLSTPYGGFGAVGTQSNLYQGSMGLFALYTGHVITLKKDNGGLFSLLAIDLADFMGGSWGYHSVSATLTGVRADASQVSYQITTDALYGYQTFELPGFYNLTQVYWTQGFPQHQFDNLVIRYDVDGKPLPEPVYSKVVAFDHLAGAGVPEPTTIVGLLLAGTGLGFSRLVKRQG